MSERDASFSEREVSLILRRAAEIEATGRTRATGLTATDVEAVAVEAGIPREAVRRAIEELRLEPTSATRWWSMPYFRRASRTLPVELDRDGLAELVRAIERQVGRPGSLSEALGTVRWSSTAGLWSTEVSISSHDGETRVGVHERIVDDKRRLFDTLPPAWGAMAGVLIGGVLGLPVVTIPALAVGWGAVGFGIGRLLYRSRSEASRGRVERLAADLAENTRRIAEEAPRRIADDGLDGIADDRPRPTPEDET